MSSISKYKNGWLLLLFIMIGIVIGGLISEVTAGVSGLSWLSYGNTFGINSNGNPLVLDLGILVITVASIIGVIAAIVIYRFI